MIKAIREKLTQWKELKAELKTRSTLMYVVADWGETLLVALVMALIFRHYVIQVSVVPTGSMIPTFNEGDRCLVNRFIYKFSEPERGDIMVFKSPYGKGDDYVKRCIGLPGERVRIVRGIVYINDTPLVIPGARIRHDLFYMDEVQVPEGHYFALGDNRGFSKDSRFFGFVSKEDLTGQAFFSFWPLSRMRLLN